MRAVSRICQMLYFHSIALNLEDMSLFIYLLCHHLTELIKEKEQVMNKEALVENDFEIYPSSISGVFTHCKYLAEFLQYKLVL